VVADPDHWRPRFESIRFPRTAHADFVVGGHRYGAFVHDWRVDPPLAWVQVKVALEPGVVSPAPVATPLIVLSQPDFFSAVRQALRDFQRPQLADNPLLRSRMAAAYSSGAATAETLRSLLREACTELQGHPRDAKLQRCLVCTFLEPVGTQEAAAERLGLPFNTYRYQLNAAIERVCQSLWRRELEASDTR